MARRSGAAALLLTVPLALSASNLIAQERSCVSKRTKIVGGEQASIQDWPGQAALRLHSDDGQVSYYFCGGTVISEQWVLTTAHCMPGFLRTLTGSVRSSKGKELQGRLEIVLGSGDPKAVPAERAFPVDLVIMHEVYLGAVDKAMEIADEDEREQSLERIAVEVGYDIALIKLGRPWAGAVAELSLAPATDPVPPPSTQVRVAGFGKTETNKHNIKLDRFERADGHGEIFAGSARLLEAAIETIPISTCASRYPGTAIGAAQFCAA